MPRFDLRQWGIQWLCSMITPLWRYWAWFDRIVVVVVSVFYEPYVLDLRIYLAGVETGARNGWPGHAFIKSLSDFNRCCHVCSKQQYYISGNDMGTSIPVILIGILLTCDVKVLEPMLERFRWSESIDVHLPTTINAMKSSLIQISIQAQVSWQVFDWLLVWCRILGRYTQCPTMSSIQFTHFIRGDSQSRAVIHVWSTLREVDELRSI